MRVSVLGCGWLGLPLAAELAVRGHEVRGSVTHAEKLTELERVGVRGHVLELTPEPVGHTEGFFGPDVLVLTLPPKRREAGVRERYPAQIAAALAQTPKTARVVLTGSTSVYPDLNRIVTEADAGETVINIPVDIPGEPPISSGISDSGRAILAAEALVRGRGGTVLRLAGLYGYDRQPGLSLAGRDVSGGDARVNLVHRDDVVRALVHIVEAGVQNATFNVCADRHPTRRAVYTRQAERFGLPLPRFIKPHEQAHKLVSSEALKAALNFAFRYPDPLTDAP